MRFFINFERKIEENSYTDWTVKSSNNEQHSTFCEAQIPFHLREFSQYIAETGTPLEIQNDRRKYSRFGPGQPLMRAFRTVHTKKSVISGHLAIDQTKLDFNFDLKGKKLFIYLFFGSTFHHTTLFKKTQFFSSNLGSLFFARLHSKKLTN